MTTSTTGTGTITLGSAVSGWLSFANAGVTNGQIVSYGIYDSAGASETGTGTYTSSGTTLTRTVTTSTNSNSAINLSGNAEVYICARAQDIGSIIWISTGTASSSATLDFSGLDTATYKNFLMVFRNIIPATDNVNFYLRVGTGAGPTYQATGYTNVGGASTVAITMQQNDFTSLFQVGNDANLGICGSVLISALDGADLKMATGDLTARNTTLLQIGFIDGYWGTATAITALRVMFSSGNIASGSVDLYGMKANM